MNIWGVLGIANEPIHNSINKARTCAEEGLKLQFWTLCRYPFMAGHIQSTLGRGAMVAQRTLDPFILVRIRAPQPD